MEKYFYESKNKLRNEKSVEIYFKHIYKFKHISAISVFVKTTLL